MKNKKTAASPPRGRERTAPINIDRVYTRRGDSGTTHLVGGEPIDKDAIRVEAYGSVDELNSCIGLALAQSRGLSGGRAEFRRLVATLRRLQHELFNLGAELARPPRPDGTRGQLLGEDGGPAIARLEAEIDTFNDELPPLTSFVLPGGTPLSAALHICRAVCRRAERRCVALGREIAGPSPAVSGAIRYLNRLSDALFVFSRWADLAQGADEELWDPSMAHASKGQANRE